MNSFMAKIRDTIVLLLCCDNFLYCVCCVPFSSLMGQRWPAVLGMILKKIHSFIHIDTVISMYPVEG